MQGILLIGFVLVGTLIVAGIHMATGQVGHKDMGVDQYPALNEVWSYGEGDTKVVTIPLHGLILLDGNESWMGPVAGSADMALQSIHRATHDPEVRALILQIDSPGGGITASDVIYDAILAFKQHQEGRVVIALFGDVAASGAYYIAMAADYILAHPTTITGSIGVLMQSINAHELAMKIGIQDVTIKSGPNKDLLNPLAPTNAAQTAILQDLVNGMYVRFVNLVADRRDLPVETVRTLADGRVFAADQAAAVGLIDGIGYWSDAVNQAAEWLNTDAVKVYRYEPSFSFSSFLRAAQPQNPLSAWLRTRDDTRLMYLWNP